MPAFAAQYQFAAAFTVFLVALAGLSLVVLRGQAVVDRVGARVAMAFGFIGIGAVSFLVGSLLVEDRRQPALLGLMLAGVAGLVVGSFRWQASALSRTLLWLGCGGLVLGAALEGANLSGAAAAVAAIGALLIGAALLGASRRAVAARIAASAAATLLLVVLLLSVALSLVLGDTVEDQTLRDLDSRAVTEAGAVEAQVRTVGRDAFQVATLLTSLPESAESPQPVLALIDANGTPTPEQRERVARALDGVRRSGYPDTSFLYISQRREIIAAAGIDAKDAPAAAAPVIDAAIAQRQGASTIVVGDDSAYIVGVLPVEQGGQPLGAIVAAYPLDDDYLASRTANVSDDSVALATTNGIAGLSGDAPDGDATRELVNDVLVARRPSATRTTDEQLLAAQPIRVRQQPVLALLAARSTAAVDASRERLFQTFFVIAFGGAVLAVLLAAIVGNRIGSGVRRLTTSAAALQRGEFDVRSGVRSEDEVGVLGETFDSMAASIQQQTHALEEAAARVEAIVEGMGEALVAVDGEGRITDFNHAAVDLLGLDAAEALGQRIDEVVHVAREDGSDLTPRLRALDAEGGRWSELGDLVASDETRIPVALTGAALHGPDGAVTGGVLVVRDLRGEREVERMKRHFLSRVGHELRTPLTPLIGYSQILAGREVPPDRARQIHQTILSSAKRLERIVEMLEFFASLDAGRQVMIPEPVDVRSLLTTVVDRRAPALAETGVSLSRRVARETPMVDADPRWLGRSIDELIDNAAKFSPGGGRVVVTAGRSSAEPGFVEIAVRDSGVGMTPEQVDAAFTEWTQGDESDTRSFGGLGLGLPLVQRVIERFGGRVVCTTAPGKGSTFALLLPALEDLPQRDDEGPARRRRSPADGGSEP